MILVDAALEALADGYDLSEDGGSFEEPED